MNTITTQSQFLETFTSYDFGQVRAILINGEPWLVGKDVANILGYNQPSKAIREHVDEDDKGVSVLDTPGGHHHADCRRLQHVGQGHEPAAS